SRIELRRLKSLIDQAFRRLVAAGVEEGSLRPCDPKLTAFTIAGGLSWIGRWYQPGGERSGDEIVQQCVATLMDGVVHRAHTVPPSKPGRRQRPSAASA